MMSAIHFSLTIIMQISLVCVGVDYIYRVCQFVIAQCACTLLTISFSIVTSKKESFIAVNDKS